MNTTTCFSCHAIIPDIEGPTHSYMLSSPGCWKVFGEILSKDYSPEFYDDHTHRLVVETYAVTHPGDMNNRKAVRSVNIHLMSLFCVFEKDLKGRQLLKIIMRAAEEETFDKDFVWLTPPNFEKTLKVSDVVKATTPAEHHKFVEDWAFSVWQVWKEKHYAAIERLVNEL